MDRPQTSAGQSASANTESRNPIVRRATRGRERNQALAGKLRKTGRIAALSAGVSSDMETIAGIIEFITNSIINGRDGLTRLVRDVHEREHIHREYIRAARSLAAGAEDMLAGLRYIDISFDDNKHALSEAIEELSTISGLIHETGIAAERFLPPDALESVTAKSAELVDFIDVTGLNASLEGGKISGSEPIFHEIARKIQQLAARAEEESTQLATALENTGAGGDKLTEMNNELGQHVRTLTVMSEGLMSAFQDIAADLLALSDTGETIQSATVGLLEEGSMLIPELASLEDTSQDILDALESVAPSLAACEDSFADAAEFADRMADDSVRLAQEDTPLVLEAAFSSSEGVMEAAEELESSLNSLFTGFEHAAEEAQSFTQNTHLDETTAEQDIKKLIESLKSMRMRVKDITGSLRDSSSVLSSIADEYSHFRDAHTSLLDEIRNLLRTIRRLAVAASAYETIASELETISLAASVETARAGESAVGFSTIPQRLEDIARRSRESAGQIRDFTDNLESSAELCSDYLAQQSEIIPSSIEHLIDDVTAFVEKELTDYSNSIEESISSGMEVSGHSNSFGNLIRDAADKSNEITESFNQIVSQINECRKVIGNTFEKCEHICAIIEELYPEEL